MNFQDQTGRSIDEAFEIYHAANPKMYDLFTEQVLRAKRKKKKKISSKLIINWIRWEEAVDVNSMDSFKINDAFQSRYSRLYIKDHPEDADLFNFRELRNGSEMGMVIAVDSYRIGIMKKMRDGKIIHYYKLNNLSYLVDPKKTTTQTSEPITSPSLNKLVKDRFIAPINPTELLIEYVITKKGLESISDAKDRARKVKAVRKARPVKKPVAKKKKPGRKKNATNQIELF